MVVSHEFLFIIYYYHDILGMEKPSSLCGFLQPRLIFILNVWIPKTSLRIPRKLLFFQKIYFSWSKENKAVWRYLTRNWRITLVCVKKFIMWIKFFINQIYYRTSIIQTLYFYFVTAKVSWVYITKKTIQWLTDIIIPITLIVDYVAWIGDNY